MLLDIGACGRHGAARALRAPLQFAGDADITLRIGELTVEFAPRRTIRTLAYNGQVPGPLLRARRGTPLTVDIWNDTKDEDIVHWHGFHIPSDVDGSYEEGTPGVPPNGGRRRYAFTPEPAGTRWYHSHTTAGRNLKKSTCSTNGIRTFTEGPMEVEFRAFSIASTCTS